MAETDLTETKVLVLFCLLLIQVSVSEIIFEERFEGILFICLFPASVAYFFRCVFQLLLTTCEKFVKFG